MEAEPVLHLNLGDGRKLESTRENTSLFRFFGALAMYDHVFIVTDVENNVGSFIFQSSAAFEDIADHIMMHDYPAHLNLREVAECDRSAFERMIESQVVQDLESGIPTDWE